jgi:predicted AAA+ superfamily ATPase
MEDLLKWKNSGNNRAFVLEGARQTGKTFIVDFFCKTNFKDYLYLNLLSHVNALDYIKECKTYKEYLSVFNYLSPSHSLKEGTVIFIEEIQLYADILTHLKFLAIDGRYRYIVSGSLLGLEMQFVRSVPAGYAEFHILYPLNFYEYLLAFNIPEETIHEVSENIRDLKPISVLYYDMFTEIFEKYLFTGGYPAAVQDYLDNESAASLFSVLKFIKNYCYQDFAKYESIDKRLSLKNLYERIPTQLNNEYNRFYLKELGGETIKYPAIEHSLSWIIEAGYAYRVNLSNDLTRGFTNTSKESFKLYLNDVGILGSMYGDSFQMGIFSKSKDINMGMIYENFVCTELTCKGYQLHYFKSKKYAELEFGYYDLKRSLEIPVEVKSGKNFKEHKSLDYVLNTYKHYKYGFVLANTNIDVVDRVVYLPIWAIGLYPELKESDFIKELDS